MIRTTIHPARIAHIARIARPRKITVKASWQSVIIEQSALVGKGLTLFVLFTSTLNYLHYRRIRKDLDNKDDI